MFVGRRCTKQSQLHFLIVIEYEGEIASLSWTIFASNIPRRQFDRQIWSIAIVIAPSCQAANNVIPVGFLKLLGKSFHRVTLKVQLPW
jgi:hypothetical protein